MRPAERRDALAGYSVCDFVEDRGLCLTTGERLRRGAPRDDDLRDDTTDQPSEDRRGGVQGQEEVGEVAEVGLITSMRLEVYAIL